MPDTIAIFLPSLHGGGAERVMLSLAKGFTDKGYYVHLVLAEAKGPYLDQVPPDVKIVNLNASRVLFSLPALIRYMSNYQPDYCLSALTHANIAAVWAAALAGAKTRVVVSERNIIRPDSSSYFRTKLFNLLMKYSYGKAHAVTAVSDGVANDLTSIVKIPQEKVHVIYNPVNEEALTYPTEVPHPWLKTELPPVIIAAGRFTEQKDFETLIKAFAAVRKNHEARLILLGEGERRQEYEKLLKNLGLQEHVAMPGFVEHPYSYMKYAAVYVLSSKWEGLPNVLIEALAYGIPIVATDCHSGPKEILKDGKYGLLVPVGNKERLAEAIEMQLRNPKHINTREAIAPFNFDDIVRRYLAVLTGDKPCSRCLNKGLMDRGHRQ